jgi:hypothetical protein
LLDRAAQAGDLVVYANIARLAILNQPGDHELSEVPLTRVGELRHPLVSVNPTKVRAVLRVKQPDVDHVLPTMSVFELRPPGVLDNYQVSFPPQLFNVRLVGPPEEIALLQSDRYSKPVAILEIRPEDIANLDTEISRTVTYWGLPSGVRVVEEGGPRQVRFRVTRAAGD